MKMAYHWGSWTARAGRGGEGRGGRGGNEREGRGGGGIGGKGKGGEVRCIHTIVTIYM